MLVLYTMVMYNGDQIFRCGVCHEEIRPDEIIFQDITHFRLVCSTCNSIFTEEELELVINIFLSHGGYFGKKKNKSSSFDLLDTIVELGSKLNLYEMKISLLHKALLYGVTPKEHIKQLELLVI